MWLITSIGFFSVVQKSGDASAGRLTVRARVREDLDRLREQFLPTLGATTEGAGTDYLFRATVPRADLAQAVAAMVADIDYSNFKNEVGQRQGHVREHVYHDVWHALAKLESAPAESSRVRHAGGTSAGSRALSDSAQTQLPAKRRGLAAAYGGVVIDKQDRVLLRRPANGFDGYAWTFAKGRPDRNESPEDAALREVREETGYAARILLPIPGEFEGGTTINRYFLMEPVGSPDALDGETEAVTWASRDEAARLIGQTTNAVGRARDLAVLQAAFATAVRR